MHWQSSNNPISRFSTFLCKQSLWSAEQEAAYKKGVRKDILRAFVAAEKKAKPDVKEMFTDVYEEMTWGLKEQERELNALMKEHPEYYGQPSKK